MRGFRVAVIDCDYPQYSVLRQRQRDTASAEASALVRQRLEAQFGRLDRQPYPVLAARPQTALREWEQYAARGQESCQAVLFDLPGTMGTEGVLSTLAALDYLVVPLKADRMVLESSLNFAATLNDRLITTGASRLRGIFLFWNLVDRRERNRLYDIYATGISQLGLRLLHSRIPVRAALGRDLVPGTWAGRSALLPPDAALARECGLADLMNELCLALNLDPKDEGRNG